MMSFKVQGDSQPGKALVTGCAGSDAFGSADGYFVFDMVHVRQYNYWDALKKGMDSYLKTLKK